MALSDKKILEEMDRGNITIHPFTRAQLATSSYDVTLGEWYFREKQTNNPVYNIWDKEHTDQVWGCEAEPAQRADETSGLALPMKGIKPEDKVILIAPGETILAHTNEFIGGRNTITTMMKARSSMGRNFIEVCKCAGWGDVGFFNRWTMEITNISRRHTIPLVVGRRIAQIVFFETGQILDRSYSDAGKYQTSSDLSELQAKWSPSLMLPRLHKDAESKK
jgi:dCTP deaminase